MAIKAARIDGIYVSPCDAADRLGEASHAEEENVYVGSLAWSIPFPLHIWKDQTAFPRC